MYRPDLNPIEHRWDQLKRRVRRRNLVPSTREELRIAAAREEWNVVPQGHIQSLLSSTQAVNSLPEDTFFGKVSSSSGMEATRIQLWKPDRRNYIYGGVGERYVSYNVIIEFRKWQCNALGMYY